MPTVVINAHIFGLAVIAAAVVIFIQRSRSLPLPPGPPSVPLLGNIRVLPLKSAWLDFAKMRERFGDLLMFHGLGNHILVVSSAEMIVELLEKRHAIYSDRPVMVMVGELAGFSQCLGLMQYGDKWREQRKVSRTILGTQSVLKYHTCIEAAARSLCHDISRSPENFVGHLKLATGRIIISSVYGIEVGSVENEFISDAETFVHWATENLIPGKHLCDMFPWLARLPSWMPFHRSAQLGKGLLECITHKPYSYVKQHMSAGTALPSAVQGLIEKSGDDMTDSWEYAIQMCAANLYAAGAETMYSTLMVFILGITLHPDKQARAQAELEEFLGPHRLPEISDMIHLPYVNALIKETMRWHPVVPLGVARALREEDVYHGYRIPKGTIVIPNVWALSREPHPKYSPEDFVPERFLDANIPVMDPTSWAFGFGRRVCPGKLLAERTIFLMASHILVCFNTESVPGNPPQPTFRPDGLTSFPSQFPCIFKPRRNLD